MLMVNNLLSFSVNVRLIFTPLFGDYTAVGRLIGFTVRIVEIVFGMLLMLVTCVFYVALPTAWLLLPLALFYQIKFYTIPLAILIYIAWSLLNTNVPEKRCRECNQNTRNKSFKPSTLKHYELLRNDYQKHSVDFLETYDVKTLLIRLELDKQEFKEKLSEVRLKNFETIIEGAFKFAQSAGSVYVSDEELFVGLIKSIPNYESFLAVFSIKPNILDSGTKWIIDERDRRFRIHLWQEDYNSLLLGGFGKGMTGRVTPFLDSISEDLTKKALQNGYERFAVREKSIDRLSELLSASNENVLILGQPGSGKTSVVRGMAYQIMKGTSHKSLWNKRIVSMELSGILSGAKSVGEIAENLKYAISEAKASGNIILFIDEIHALIAGSDSKNPEVSAIFNLLEPELSGGTIQFIGASSIQSYRKFIEPNSAFARLFHIYEIEEASFEETYKILEFVVRELESKKKVFITFPALEKCIELSKKLIHERVLPDKAIMVLDRAAAFVEDKGKTLNAGIIGEVISEITHVPSDVLGADEAKKVLGLENEMRKSVVGQDHALKQVSDALKRARSGMRNDNKPIASFLFVGTTGVGKTQTARSLAKCYFGDPKAMIRLDMSEYQQADSISRLLGSPDGSTRGVLTEAVRIRPFALLLLDELEKAHPNILLTFLQVLDEGRLTDSTGLTIDFTNTIIISTSNVGTRSIQQVFEENGTLEKMTEVAMYDVKKVYAPEFLNRYTGIIVFNPLNLDDVRKIVDIMLGDVVKNVSEKNIAVSFSPELKGELMKRGYSKEWGARPMARVIEDTVEIYLAERILSQEFKPGDSKVLGMEIFDNKPVL